MGSDRSARGPAEAGTPSTARRAKGRCGAEPIPGPRQGLAALLVMLALALAPRSQAAGTLEQVKTVFLIVMENHDWATIVGGTNCPYLTKTLLPMASYATRYYNPTNLHPSEPNYIWLEAGTNFGVLNDSTTNRLASTNHLVTQLRGAGASWKAYCEDLPADASPLRDVANYRQRHDPMALFNDVNQDAAYMQSHFRPFSELEADLTAGPVARYNFLLPNLTNDMHTAACSGCSRRTQGDQWLAREMPGLMASAAYRDNGAVIITWDEGSAGSPSDSDGPIGLIILSPLGKGQGYHNAIYYTHSSTLRTLQEIFGVRPFLGDAANATDLADLFRDPPRLGPPVQLPGGRWRFPVTDLRPGAAVRLETTTGWGQWRGVMANTAINGTVNFDVSLAPAASRAFFRAVELP